MKLKDIKHDIDFDLTDLITEEVYERFKARRIREHEVIKENDKEIVVSDNEKKSIRKIKDMEIVHSVSVTIVTIASMVDFTVVEDVKLLSIKKMCLTKT